MESSTTKPGVTVMIPLGGIGSRFQKEGYLRPKPFINVIGRPMLLWVLDNLQLGPDDLLVVVYDPTFLKPKFWPLITDKYPGLKRVELAGPTRGAAETVLLGLQALSPTERKRPVVLCDGDTFYTADVVGRYRKVAAEGRHGVFWFEDTQPKAIYSYVQLDGEGLVADVKEKVKISDCANSGCYCFASGTRLQAECEALLSSGERQLSQDQVGEFYTSGVIKRMVDAGEPFAGLELSPQDFHVLGTPSQVEAFCQRWPEHPKARFCFDLDHTLVTAPRVSGDYTTCEPIPENIRMVQALHAQGHYVIVATARRMRTHKGNVAAVVADVGALTLAQLRQFGVPYDEITFGKPWAHFYVDDLGVDALGDLSKQTGYYFPSASLAGGKPRPTLSGTTMAATARALPGAPGEGDWARALACFAAGAATAVVVMRALRA